MTRIGLVGYGVGGRLFHTPYLLAAEGIELVGIVTTAPARREQALVDAPGAVVVGSLAALIELGVDAVVISTPPATRQALVLEAIAAGVHVVADKPFAPDHASALALVDAAESGGVLLNVFHNRRFDTDIVTARKVRDSGALGTIQRLDLRLDQDDPATLERGSEGGLLRDLGSHVIDQALHLLGPARTVTARIDTVDDDDAGPTDVSFALRIDHLSGAHSHVSSSKVHGLDSRELRLLGRAGSYRSEYTDVQFEALRRGLSPSTDRSTWGFESPEHWGTLWVDGVRTTVPSEQGDYTLYYEEFAEAVRSGGPGPVPAREGAAVVAVLEAARRSGQTRRTIDL